MTLQDWARAQHKQHRQAAHDAGLTPLRSFHNGYVAAMLVLLGDGHAADKIGAFILAGGSQGTRGLAGFREGFAHAAAVRSFLAMLDEQGASAWAADGRSDMQDSPAGVGA